MEQGQKQFINSLISSYGNSAEDRFLIIYDGACPFCGSTVNFLRRIDFLHKFSYAKLQEFTGKDSVKIPLSLLQESIHVVDRKNGRVWNSMAAVSTLLLHSPPAFPLLVLVLLLRMLKLAEPAYKWISKSRYSISAALRG